jgi:hypothetical protein
MLISAYSTEDAVPNLNPPQAEQYRQTFLASVPLDLINAMYFTVLAPTLDGLAEWPRQTWHSLDPATQAELKALFTYPRGDPGIMGALNDVLFAHLGEVQTVDDLLRFIREMPAEGEPTPQRPGIQGLALYALRWPGFNPPFRIPKGVTPRDALAAALAEPVTADVECAGIENEQGPEAVLDSFEKPEEVRSKMLRVIRRFYDEHYRPDEERRIACMERSVQHHRRSPISDANETLRAVAGRDVSCVRDDPTNFKELVFGPSVDVGPYCSCIELQPIHGMHYPCEAQFMSAGPAEGEDDRAHRLALVYKALSDEQRLRILSLLRGGELYAQEIVERTGLHQSVVSRHLAFMKAVGLVSARRQNNMKFFSLTPLAVQMNFDAVMV